MSEAITKETIREVIREEMTLARERRIEQAMARKEQEQTGQETRLCLVTFGYRQLAVPDEHGRAIFIEAAFARVPVREGKLSCFTDDITVVAWGDGRLLKNPLKVQTGGSVALCEVPESVLKNLPAEEHAGI